MLVEGKKNEKLIVTEKRQKKNQINFNKVNLKVDKLPKYQILMNILNILSRDLS